MHVASCSWRLCSSWNCGGKGTRPQERQEHGYLRPFLVNNVLRCRAAKHAAAIQRSLRHRALRSASFEPSIFAADDETEQRQCVHVEYTPAVSVRVAIQLCANDNASQSDHVLFQPRFSLRAIEQLHDPAVLSGCRCPWTCHRPAYPNVITASSNLPHKHRIRRPSVWLNCAAC